MLAELGIPCPSGGGGFKLDSLYDLSLRRGIPTFEEMEELVA